MRVVVDCDLCESNAICMQVAPEIFEVRDDDFLYVLNEEPGEDRRSAVEEAVQRCPTQAISRTDPEIAAGRLITGRAGQAPGWELSRCVSP